jgi:hypothetical protein
MRYKSNQQGLKREAGSIKILLKYGTFCLMICSEIVLIDEQGAIIGFLKERRWKADEPKFG